jgi:hypothetical protein
MTEMDNPSLSPGAAGTEYTGFTVAISFSLGGVTIGLFGSALALPHLKFRLQLSWHG